MLRHWPVNSRNTTTYSVNLYGKQRDVVAYDSVVMIKTLKCIVRVVWVYRRSQWVYGGQLVEYHELISLRCVSQ